LISASATGLQSFYQFDGLGSVVTVTDGAASQKAGYAYDPWGTVTGGSDLLGTKNKFKYTGEAVDPSTGLVYLRARYYDPSMGHFLSRDPLPQSDHVPQQASYVYAGNSPVLHVDPTGLFSFDTFLQVYSQTIYSLPSFVGCGASGFRATGACRAQGFSDQMIDAGRAISNDAATVIVPGLGAALGAYDTAKDLAPIVRKLSNPKQLTAEDLKTLSEAILSNALNIPDTAAFGFDNYLVPYVIAGPFSSSPGNYPTSGGRNK
jgi:RHS repeat-associated protein